LERFAILFLRKKLGWNPNPAKRSFLHLGFRFLCPGSSGQALKDLSFRYFRQNKAHKLPKIPHSQEKIRLADLVPVTTFLTIGTMIAKI